MNPALLSIFLASFAIGTTEFVIAGLVPAIARDLGVDVPTAGLLVSGYAIGVAVGGPILSVLISRFERKSAVLALMGVFVLGQILCAVAPTYSLLMAARVFVSLTHGSFFGVAAILAVSIAGPGKGGSALSFIYGGISIANILGVPGGTAIGDWLGWRATFWVVGAIAVAATIAMTLFLPRADAEKRVPASLRAQLAVLLHHQVWLSYLIGLVWMISFWITFTFVAPLAEAAGVPKDRVSLVLLLFGAGAVLGTTLGGRLADWSANWTLVIGYTLQTVALLGLALFAGSAIGIAVTLALTACAGFSTAAALQAEF
jgi:MFS transporter, DHA1 family, inner membrane transport protein